MDIETTTPVAETEKGDVFLYELFIQFFIEAFEFFKYIFYDVFRGVEL